MRYQIVSVATAVLLLASFDLAAQTPKDRFKAPKASVVAIMDDAGQALLFDGESDQYVVVRKGDRFHEFRVTSIDSEQVVLTRRGSNQHYVLPRTSDTSDLAKKRRANDGATSTAPIRTADGNLLLDPYAQSTAPKRAPASISGSGIINPYGSAPHVTTVKAPKKGAPPAPPLDPYADAKKSPGIHVREVSARKPGAGNAAPLDPYAGSAGAGSATGSAPLDPYGGTAANAGTSPSAPLDPYGGAAPNAGTSPSAPLDPYGKDSEPRTGKTLNERHRISRTEFDAAVNDFHELSKEVQFAIISTGVQIQGISRGSLFYRWGFRDHDVVLDVDGKPIRGVDDAAAVYAHLMGAKRFKVKVQRGADTVILNYRFKK